MLDSRSNWCKTCLMISAKNRFHGLGSLRYVYRSGQTIRGQAFSLKYLINPKRKTYRLAVVVSKKVSKSAVVRNRIRRRLYEAVRLLAPDIVEPYDLVIIVYNDSLLAEPSDNLRAQVEKQLRSAGVLVKRVVREKPAAP